MGGASRSEPKFLAVFSSLGARRYSVRAETPDEFLPIWMRGVCQSEPEFLAVFTSLNARRFSVGTEMPGGVFQFKCEAFVSQSQNSWQYFPVVMRGFLRSEPRFLAIFPSLGARSYSVRTQLPGGIFQFSREEFFGQNQGSWRYFPV